MTRLLAPMAAALGSAALLALLPAAAQATSSFDPTTSEATFDDTSPLVTDVEGLPLWDRIERHQDPDAALFRQEDFADGQEWDDSDVLAPHLASLFGSPTPSSDRFLLHFAPGWAFAPRDVPVLLVPGTSSSASGVFGPLARSLAARGRAVFALSFAHPNGDCFQQAEQVANAIARVRELTGAAQVDLVGHSKGGIASAVHLGHRAGMSWGDANTRGARFSDRGTPYQGDVRRFVAAGVPFGGVDTAFRWTATHLATALGSPALVASAWTYYYPMTTTVLGVSDDLRGVDLWPEEADSFPGQRQVLAPWDDVHELPGARPELGVFALQQDWLTTWVGGFGLYSLSPGLDDAIEAGGGLIERLAQAPLDPAVELSVLAGANPLIPVDRAAVDPDVLGDQLPDFLGLQSSAYRDLLEGPLASDFPDLLVTDAEIDALSDADMILGEITGLSDGLVFAASATDTAGLLSDGATLVEQTVVQLSHLDLLFASTAIGDALIAQGAEPNSAHLVGLGTRYVAADSLGWIAAQLERGEDAGDDDDDSAGDDDDSAGDDDDSAGPGDDDDSAGPEPETPWTGCTCAAVKPGPTWLFVLLLPLLRRRR